MLYRISFIDSYGTRTGKIEMIRADTRIEAERRAEAMLSEEYLRPLKRTVGDRVGHPLRRSTGYICETVQ